MLTQWLLLTFLSGWIMGLLLLLYFPHFPQRPRFSPFPGSGKKRHRILLLVAHPDDECMFFGPTMLTLTKEAAFDIRVLSVSCGNADGLGECRKLEMLSSCTVFKVPTENVEVLDHPSLQDGFNEEWDRQLLVQIIKQRVEAHKIDSVITFDSYGVSGHPNHSALSRALRSYLLENSVANLQIGADTSMVTGWELVSLNIARKYAGLLEICLSTLGWVLNRNKKELYFCVTPNPRSSVAAMAQHKSQWVWFRKLFVLLAAYTYVNTLTKINTEPTARLKSI